MVALLTKLSYKLYISSIRSGWAIAGLVLRWLYLIGILGAFFGFVLFAHTYAPDVAPRIVIGFGSFFAMFMVGASVLFPDTDYLLPEKFALLPVPGDKLSIASVLATAILPTGIATVLLAGIAIIAYLGNALALVTAIIAIPLFLLQSILLDKVIAGFLARVFANKNLRILVSGVLFFVLYTGLVVSNSIFGGKHGSGVKIPAEIFDTALNIASFSPLVSALGVSYHFHAGNLISGVICLVETIVLIIAAALLHKRQVAARLTNPVSYKGDAKVKSASVIDRFFPATAMGAIAARRLKYFLRDPRHIMVTFTLVLFIVIMVINGRNAHDLAPFAVLFSLPLAGSVMQTDVAFDHRAFAFHILHGVSGKDDRYGRTMVILPLILTPGLIIAPIVGVIFHVMHNVLPAMLSLVAIGCTCVGVGNVIGVFMPGAAPKPGTNPLTARKKGSGIQAAAGTYITLLLQFGLQLPMLVMLIWGEVANLPVLTYSGLIIGIIMGVVYLIIGLRIGAKKLETRWDKLYADVTKEA